MKARLRAIGLGLATAAAILAGSGPASALGERRASHGFVYTMSNATEGNAVLAFRRAETGELTAAGSFATGGRGNGGGLGNQGGLVWSQDQHWLLAVNAGSNDITVFSADDDESLTKVAQVPSGGEQPVSIAVDDDLVYVLNAGSDSISGFRLTGQGRFERISGSIRSLGETGTAPAQISFSPDGQSLVITERSTNKLAVFGVNRNGLPDGAPKVEPSAGQTPFGFSFRRGRTLFVSEAGSNSVSSYRLRRDGGLSVLAGAVPTNQRAVCWIVLTPDGRFAYTSNTASQSITGFRVKASGELTLLHSDGLTASTNGNGGPIDSVISSDGQFLYTLNRSGGTISTFRIGRDGGLAAVATLRNVPTSANGLVFR